MNYDVVIMLSENKLDILDLLIERLRRFISFKDIVFVGALRLESYVKDKGVRFIDEDSLYEGLTYDQLRNLIAQKDPFAEKRTGWYLQQFLKYAYALKCTDEYYLIWDADLLPLNKLCFFDENEFPYFDIKFEFLPTYFCTLKKLFRGEIGKEKDYSYISEHMMVKTEFMRALLEEIENNSSLVGEKFFEKIMNTIRIADLPGTGFSEFETFGSYVEKRYPGFYKIRIIRSLREGDLFLGEYRSEKYMKWAAESYDLINFERNVEQIPELMEGIDDYMSRYSLEEVVGKFDEYIIYF